MSPMRGFSDRIDRRDAALPLLVFVAGLLASLAAAAGFWRIAELKDRERFEHAIVQTQDAIVGRLDTYVALLQAGSGLFAASSGGVTRDEFAAFNARLRLRERYPGIQGIGFSRYIRPGEAAAVAAEMRAQGFEDFRITPDPPRPQLHSIVYLEPLDRRNRAAIGYDMYSDPTRRAAMARARDTGGASTSGKVELVQEIDQNKQAGFLIYVPVYAGDPAVPPRTVAERRARLAGFVYAPFRADDLLAGIFGGTRNRRVDFAIYDGAPMPANLLHRSGEAVTADDPAFSGTRALTYRGRDWTVRYASRAPLEGASSRLLAPLIGLAGALASAIIAWVVWLQAKARRRADAAADAHAASEAHLKLLVNELNHRVKNTLATVQSLIWQTLRSADLDDQVRRRLDARIMALSAAHNVLTRENWDSAALRDIVDEALAPFRGATAGRLSVEGPPLRVAPKAALAIAMALHELATNAIKYGALSNDAGQVELRWEPVGDDRLRLTWCERGGPPVTPPSRQGFGGRLIERGLAHDLGGSVRIDYDPAGVICVADAIRTA
jgi:CHASE1-domain containing sensor protein/two-component sensor histidine kinase